MIDLFGLGKHPDPQEPDEHSESSSTPDSSGTLPSGDAAVPRGSHKLWAFLLVLDSIFVIIFAGAVAAKVYQHWKEPAVASTTKRRRRPTPPAPVPVAPPAPAPDPAPAPEPAKAPEPPKPAAAKADAPRPPKPSMLADAPKHRATPKPADAGGKSAPAAKPAAAPDSAKVKAIRTEFKLSAPKAKLVELVGAFIVRGGRKEMERESDGTWTITLYLNPGDYRYFFAVDKKKVLDPQNPQSKRGASLLAVP